jgi:SAM-dependent methyltransferase
MLHNSSKLSVASAPVGEMGVSDTWALQELVNYLCSVGYGEFYASFNPLAPRLANWQAHRWDVPEYLRALVELFLLAVPVELSELDETLVSLIDPLSDLGLLIITDNNCVATPDLVLLPVFGHWLFCQRPQINPTLYFGDDSVALLLRLHPRRNGHCLDLCAGPGVQTLYCSLFASKVTAVEINPVAAALASLNAVLNGRQDVVTVYCGDLYEPVGGQVFDTIVANPPLLPFPDDIFYPFVGHGGADGMRVTWRILHGLPTALAKEGTAQMIGSCLSDGILPLCVDALSFWASETAMNVLLTVTAHQPLEPGTPYFDGLVRTAANAVSSEIALITKAYQRALTEQRATHLCTYFLHITRGTGALHIQDMSRDGKLGLWYV